MHNRLLNFVPGILLCIVLTAVAALLEAIEIRLFHAPYLEALVLAIILVSSFEASGHLARSGTMESNSVAKFC
jgi:uncharacterized membrane protein YadS